MFFQYPLYCKDLPKLCTEMCLSFAKARVECLWLLHITQWLSLVVEQTWLSLKDLNQRWQEDANEVLLLHLTCETAAVGQRLGRQTGRRWDYQNKAQRVRKWKFSSPKGFCFHCSTNVPPQFKRGISCIRGRHLCEPHGAERWVHRGSASEELACAAEGSAVNFSLKSEAHSGCVWLINNLCVFRLVVS